MRIISSINHIQKSHIKIFWATLLLAIIGLSGISQYGITWDEQMNIDMVKWNLEYLRDGDRLSEHFKHHGFIFNYTSNLIYELQYEIKKFLFPSKISIALDMAALHSYEYTYFNQTYGGLKAAHRQQETDYWKLSLKEGIEWLNQHAKPNSTILNCWPSFCGPSICGSFSKFYHDPS